MAAILSLLVGMCVASGSAGAAEADYDAIAAAIDAGRLAQAREMLAITPQSEQTIDSERLSALTAGLAFAEGRNALAHALYAALDAAHPGQCPYARGAALARYRIDDGGDSLPLLLRARDTCPDDAGIWSALGVCYAQHGDWSESDRAFDRAVTLAPEDPRLLNNRGFALVLQKRFVEAVGTLGRAQRAAPRDERIANNLLIARVLAGEAVSDSRAIAMIPETLGNAGYAAYLAGDLDSARAWLSRALLASDVYQPRTAANLALVEEMRHR